MRCLPATEWPDERSRRAARSSQPDPPAGGDNGARDAAREALFAELEDDVRQLAFVDVAQNVGGRRPLRAIHPHVQGLVAPEAEAAPCLLELHRRHAKVGERAVNRIDAAPGEDGRCVAVVRVDELDAIGKGRERLGRTRERLAIPIEADEPRHPGTQKRRRMAAVADGTVKVETTARRRERLDRFGNHDGFVHTD